MTDEFSVNFDKVKDALLDNLLSRSFDVETEEGDNSEIEYLPAMEGVGASMPIFDEEDRDILLHRDAHFASSFELMLKSYMHDDPSAVLDVEVEKIKMLATLEEKLQKNIAPLVLHAQDALTIACVKKMYTLLREVLEKDSEPLLQASSELILQEDPEEHIEQKCLFLGKQLINKLITIIRSETLYNPLFPGYGKAPLAAAKILGKMKATEAIYPLFFMLESDSFDVQSASLSALKEIGDEAKAFAIKQLQSRPLSKNNEYAALLLSQFASSPDVADVLIESIKDPAIQKSEPLILYVLSCAEELSEKYRDAFYEVCQTGLFSKEVKEEIEIIAKMWKKK